MDPAPTNHPELHSFPSANPFILLLFSSNTQNTFHSAGAGNKTVQRGVPRVKEIIDTSKNPATPSMEIYFRPEIAHNEAVVRRIATEMTLKILRDYVVGYTLHRVGYDYPESPVTPAEDEGLVSTHNALYPEPSKPDWSAWLGRLVLNKEALLEKGMRVSHVKDAARAYLSDKVQVVASEDDDDTWLLRLRICKMATIAKRTNAGMSPEERDPLDKVATTDVVEILMDTLTISGVSDITNTYVARRGDEFIIETDGSSLAHILASGDAIDFKKCTSNHIHEVMAVLGIEAACSLIYREAADVLSDSGEYVSCRHLMLLR